ARSERALLPLRGHGARDRRVAADGHAARAGRSARLGRPLAEPARRRELRPPAARVPDQSRPLGDRRHRAAAEPPSARRRRHRGRAASGDPRPAIAERYGSRDDYLKRVRAAARALVEDGYLLEEDVETSLTFAARMWDAFA